jgi:hypothetical protein
MKGDVTAQTTTVETFLAWLPHNVPSIHASLAPPATAVALEALVQTCGGCACKQPRKKSTRKKSTRKKS